MSRSPLLIQAFSTPLSLIFLEGQVAYYQQQGLTVKIMCSSGAEAERFADRNGCEVQTVPFSRIISPFQDLWALLLTYRYFIKEKPLIVHGNTPKAALISMLAARLARVPVRIYEMHGLPLESRTGLMRRLLVWMERLTSRSATMTVAVSASLRQQALHYGINRPEKIVVLGAGSCNGVDAQGRFNPENLNTRKIQEIRKALNLRGRVIGFIGRFTRDKGILELAAAWRKIKERYSDVTLLLIGPSELGAMAHQPEVVALLTDEAVRRIDYIRDIENYYAVLDALVLPTYREGLPNVLIEASAMQVPVVASRVTGAVDAVIDNRTGLLCEPQSADSLFEQVCRYLDNPELARRHGVQGREWVCRAFKPEQVWEAKYALYNTLARRAGQALGTVKAGV